MTEKHMEYPDKTGTCAILIVSCDKYKDLWGPCITLLRRFWNDCPYPIYLLSNSAKADFPDVCPIVTGNDDSWSDNLLYALQTLPHEYVLLYIEDLFLIDNVHSAKVSALIQRCMNAEWNYLRLNPTPKGDSFLDSDISIISPGSVYRSSVVFSVWKKNILLKLLQQGESAWDFEEYGTERTDEFNHFYAANHTLIPACNTVIKGVWDRQALKKIQELGIQPDLSQRRSMTTIEMLKWKLKQLRSLLFHLFPNGSKRFIRSIFR